jgi:phosphoglycerol transferase
VTDRRSTTHDTKPREGARREAVFYVVVVVVAVLLTFLALRLWRADLRVPFSDVTDARFTAAVVRGLVTNGSYLDNPSLGAPFGMHLQDFPGSDGIHVALVRLMALGSNDYAVAINLFFLLGFPLAALTFAFALRTLKVSPPAAFVGAQLFAFLPYHFLRGEVHLFLAAYWPIPFVLVLCAWLVGSPGGLFVGQLGEHGKRVPVDRVRSIWAVVMALVLSSSGIYFAYFSCFFLAVAGAMAVAKSRAWKRAVPAVLLVAIIVLGVLANVAPTLAYRRANGPNTSTAVRLSVEAQIYGLRIDEMILPTSQYFIPRVAAFKWNLNTQLAALDSSLASTSDYAYLGIVGAIGFIVLMVWMLLLPAMGGRDRGSPGAISIMGVLALSGTLLGTLGGIGAIVAIFALKEIRAYDRISVFIGMFVLAAVAIAADTLRSRLNERRRQPYIWYAVLAVVFVVGLVDQVGAAHVPNYAALNAAYAADGAFVTRVESSVPAHSMIFQLPYVFFPEAPPVVGQPSYAHFMPYLHSSTLRWSFGAVAGRPGAAWIESTSDEPVPTMLASLRKKGFAGIWVDTRGYKDRAVALEAELSTELNERPLVSAGGTYVFYPLAP